MKKTLLILWIVSLFVLTACNNPSPSNQTSNNKEVIGWPCEYTTYIGQCKITTINKTSNWNLVKYNYTTKANVDSKFLNKTYTLKLLNWQNPTDNFLKKYNLYTWKILDCNLKIIKEWTCTPTIIELSWVNITDYNAQKASKNLKSKTTSWQTASKEFHNEYFSIKVLSWRQVKSLESWKIEITKDNYVLLINPKYFYAGWAENWVFNCVIENLPRKNLVINYLPAVNCWISKISNLWNWINETDLLYSNKSYIKWACNKLNDDNKTIRYLSYFAPENWYFFKTNNDNSHYIVIATYSTDNINNLPETNSNYKSYLKQISNMVKTLKIK